MVIRACNVYTCVLLQRAMAIASVFLLILIVFSCWREVEWTNSTGAVRVRIGGAAIDVEVLEPRDGSKRIPRRRGFEVRRPERYRPLYPTIRLRILPTVGTSHVITFPLWIISGALGCALFFSLRMRIPTEASFPCSSCGYSLIGNVSGKCPECGTPCERATEDALARSKSKDD